MSQSSTTHFSNINSYYNGKQWYYRDDQPPQFTHTSWTFFTSIRKLNFCFSVNYSFLNPVNLYKACRVGLEPQLNVPLYTRSHKQEYCFQHSCTSCVVVLLSYGLTACLHPIWFAMAEFTYSISHKVVWLV